jgi:Phosphotransferase enzyme family
MTPIPVPQRVHLTALERHPDGLQWRLTQATYRGSVYYGPALAAQLPVPIQPLRRLHHEFLPDEQEPDGQTLRVCRIVWLLDGDGTGDGWQLPGTLPPEVQPWLEAAQTPDPPGRPHWQRPGGWAALLGWLDAELHEQGRPRLRLPQVRKDWGISWLAQVQTAAGPLYLKAVPDFFRAEVRVTCTLSQALPGAAAPVLAADGERGLLLLEGAGTPLDNGASGWFTPPLGTAPWTLDDSRALLGWLAQLQRGAEGLPLLGTLPDHGPEWVRAQLPGLLAESQFLTGQPGGLSAEEVAALLALRPQLEAALDHLSASPIPRTLGHGDLHDGNVVRQHGQFTLLDWSDASVTHPFLDGGPQYLVPEDQRDAAQDSYLHAWTDLLPLPGLRALLQDGLLAGELYRALGYTQGIQPHVADGDWRAAHLGHFRALLRLAAPPTPAATPA